MWLVRGLNRFDEVQPLLTTVCPDGLRHNDFPEFFELSGFAAVWVWIVGKMHPVLGDGWEGGPEVWRQEQVEIDDGQVGQ